MKYILYFQTVELFNQFRNLRLVTMTLMYLNYVLDVCSPNGTNLCRNGGTCYSNENDSINCSCPLQFEGLFCELSKSNPSNIKYQGFCR